MAGEHAEVALGAGHIDLIDLALLALVTQTNPKLQSLLTQRSHSTLHCF
jgi:hypothetical protein